MADSADSRQQWVRTGAWLARLLLCLSLLLNLSTVVVEDLKWSAADQVLDAHQGVEVSLTLKGNESPGLQKKFREHKELQPWASTAAEFRLSALSCSGPPSAHPDPSLGPASQRLFAPFPPRAPTA